MKKITIYFLLFLSIKSYSQKIYGVVLDGDTKKPIIGASVYFNNTTIGTSTNFNGEFSIALKHKIETPLVVSNMGYITSQKAELSANKKLIFLLYKSNNMLEEAIINTNDGWSREIKMKEFLKHFLGETANGRACEVLNKEEILLRFNKAKKKLTAEAVVPIIIKNHNLGFIISVQLVNFEVNYSFVSKNNRRRIFYNTYYSSTNFFKSIDDSPKTIKKRKKTYNGSLLHFMRALAKNKLLKNGYRLNEIAKYPTDNKRPVSPKKYIKIRKLDSLGVMVKLDKNLNIIYKTGKQSIVQSSVDEFFINSFGNHFPKRKVLFRGDLGNQRMGDSLPLDYLLTK
jgi:hypothetical protein